MANGKKTQQSKRLRDLDRGRNPHLAERLRERPNGFMDHRPRKQRTRADQQRAAMRYDGA
jgi:hypothetical protein